MRDRNSNEVGEVNQALSVMLRKMEFTLKATGATEEF